MLLNLCKAAVAVAVSPVLAVADIATLPASAYDGRHPFTRTRDALRTAGRALDAATAPIDTIPKGKQS